MTYVDYSSLEQEIKNAPEPGILPNNTEAKLRIVRVDRGVIEREDSQSYGAGYFLITFDVPSEPMALMFTDFFYDLSDRDKIPEAQFVRALRKFKNFADAFNIDYSRPFSWDDLVGLEGWAILGVQKDKNGEYPDKNIVKRYLPR